VEIRRIEVQDHPRQKVLKTLFQPVKSWGLGVYAYHPSYKGNINRRIVVQASLAKMQDPI
jgi:hypothetical protein